MSGIPNEIHNAPTQQSSMHPTNSPICSADAVEAAPTLRANHGITLRVAVGDAMDVELCALPKGVHNYRIPLPEALQQVLHNIPCGMFLWDGECLVLTACTLDAQAVYDGAEPDLSELTQEDGDPATGVDGANLR